MPCTQAVDTPVLPDQVLVQVGGGVMRSRYGRWNTLSKRRTAGAFILDQIC